MKAFTQILKILIILGILVQTTFAHEFSIYGGGGLHTFMYDVKDDDKSHGVGGLFGLGYSYFFTSNWGVGTGLELAFYNAEYKLKNYSQQPYMTADYEGAPFEFQSQINDYSEEQNAMLLQIPLMLQYQSNKMHNKAFYYAAGAKIGIPLKGTNKSSAASVTNSGKYYYEDDTYPTQRFMGFGTFEGEKSKKDLSMQTSVLLSTEAGMKWKLSESFRLYTGVYFDYGLNSITKRNNSDRAVEYITLDEGGTFALNSLVEEAIPLAIGLKLKVSFDAGAIGEAEERRRAEEAEVRRRADEEAARLAAAENALRKADEDREAARLAAAAAAARRAAELEAARMAAIGAGKAEKLQARIDSIQNQVLNDFRITQTKPSKKQIPALDAIIELLKDHPELRFYLNGHTCDKGDKEINKHVGYERAKAVRDYVVAKGIDESRVLGIGSKLYYEPLVPNISEDNRRKNRRVEFVIEKWLPVEDDQEE